MKYAVSTTVNIQDITNFMKSELMNVRIFSKPQGNSRTKENKDNKDLASLKKVITGNMNPFDENLNNFFLFNIKTGRQAYTETEQYCFNILSK